MKSKLNLILLVLAATLILTAPHAAQSSPQEGNTAQSERAPSYNPVVVPMLLYGSPYGGRAVAVTVNPNDSDIAIVASESGGLWRTTNNGSTWNHLDGLPMFRIIDVRYSPVNANIVIATGWSDNHNPNTGGIWRSGDGGDHWSKPATSNPDYIDCNYTYVMSSAWGIAFNPDNGNIFVGTDCGVASSQDNGATWTHTPMITPVLSLAVRQVQGSATDFNLDICTRLGHARHSGPFPLSFGSFTTPGASYPCTSVHSLALSPVDSGVVYIATSAPVPAGCERGRASTLWELRLGGGGVWTSEQVKATECLYGGREPWVETVRSHDGLMGHYDIYFGNSLHLFTRTCGTAVPLRCYAPHSWTQIAENHDDQNGMDFDPLTHCGKYVVSDGGIHHAVPATPPACPTQFMSRGPGSDNYSALQIYDMAGTMYSNHYHLYVGTQDNGIFAYGDDGVNWSSIPTESYFLQADEYATNHSEEYVTFYTPSWIDPDPPAAPVRNRYANYNLSTDVPWVNPSNTIYDTPTLLSHNTYLQHDRSGINTTLESKLMPYGVWTSYVTHQRELRSRPQVSVSGLQAFLYQVIKTSNPPSTRQEGQQLMVYRGFATDGSYTTVRATNPRQAGLDSIGAFPIGEGCFVWPSPWAVDPHNPQNVIAADVGAVHGIKISSTAGMTFTLSAGITQLIADKGYFFTLTPDQWLNGEVQPPGVVLEPHVIAYNPYSRNHIVVGTEHLGVIQSIDGGQNWEIITGTQQIPAITDFYFLDHSHGFQGETFFVSSYGRGLWRVNVPRVRTPFNLGDTNNPAQWDVEDLILDANSSVPRDFLEFDPSNCPTCEMWIAPRNQIQDLDMSFGSVKTIYLDGRHIIGSDSSGEPLPPSLATIITPAIGTFADCPACQTFVKGGGKVRGFIVNRGARNRFAPQDYELLAVIGSYGDLPGAEVIESFDAYPPDNEILDDGDITPNIAPNIRLSGSYLYGSQVGVGAGDQLEVNGNNWNPDTEHCTNVDVTINDQPWWPDVPVDSSGYFAFSLAVDYPPGHYWVQASQTCDGTTVTDGVELMVVIEEGWWAEQSIYLPIISRQAQ
jgi:hypothetical protein